MTDMDGKSCGAVFRHVPFSVTAEEMMQTKDWADALANEITEKYWHHGDGESCQDTPPKVWAAALRKAKADGRAEAFAELGLRPGDTVTIGDDTTS